MAEENLNQGGWNPKSSIGGGEGEVPLVTPGTPKIDIRTLASDAKSLEETGSVSPRPYTSPPNTSQRTSESNETTFMPPSNEPTIKPPAFEPTMPTPPPVPADLKEIKPAGKNKFLPILILVIVLGLVALGYFVVYPALFKKGPIAEPPPNPNPPPTEPPPVEPPPIVEPPPVEPPSPPDRSSLFKIPADVTINDGEPLPINLPAGSIIEIITSREKAFAGFPDSARNIFEENEFSSFVYIDSGGLSAGGSLYKLRVGGNLTEAKITWSAFFETPQNALVNLLAIAVAGAPIGWKSGQTGSITNRYLTFENTPNIAINYGWVNDKLIITSSYNAFKEAIRRLQ